MSINYVAFGLGYDSLSDDYKLFRRIETSKRGKVVYRETSVYSLRNDSWKCVNDPIKHDMINIDSGILVNETLHFVMAKCVAGKGKPLIKCFSLRDETFLTLELPNYDDNFSEFMFMMANLSGCLAVLVNYYSSRRPKGAFPHLLVCRKVLRADLWVMKEYGKKESWVKLFSFDKPDKVGVFLHARPVAYSRDGGRVLLDLSGMRLGWYNLQKSKFKRVAARGTIKPNLPFTTWPIVESLVSLEKDMAGVKDNAIPEKTEKKKHSRVDDVLSEEFKLKLSDGTNDATDLCSTRDDIFSKDFQLRLSNQAEEATDLCNA